MEKVRKGLENKIVQLTVKFEKFRSLQLSYSSDPIDQLDQNYFDDDHYRSYDPSNTGTKKKTMILEPKKIIIVVKYLF